MPTTAPAGTSASRKPLPREPVVPPPFPRSVRPCTSQPKLPGTSKCFGQNSFRSFRTLLLSVLREVRHITPPTAGALLTPADEGVIVSGPSRRSKQSTDDQVRVHREINASSSKSWCRCRLWTLRVKQNGENTFWTNSSPCAGPKRLRERLPRSRMRSSGLAVNADGSLTVG